MRLSMLTNLMLAAVIVLVTALPVEAQRAPVPTCEQTLAQTDHYAKLVANERHAMEVQNAGLRVQRDIRQLRITRLEAKLQKAEAKLKELQSTQGEEE